MLTNVLWPDRLGGLERYVRELSRNLVDAGIPVRVFTKSVGPQPRRENAPDGIQIYRHPVPSKRNPLYAAGLPIATISHARRFLAERPDWIVHSLYPIPALAVLGRPFVHTFVAPLWREVQSERQGSYFLPRPIQRAAVAFMRSLERRVVRAADTLISLSEFTRQEVALLDARAGQVTEVVPGGVDLERFSPGDPEPSHPWPGGSPMLVVARRLTPRTGVPQLVAALPLIRESFPHARLAVVGDGAQRVEVEKEVHRLGLAEAVRLVGSIGDTELRRWYRAADLVVMPTQQLEGFGLATVEALACGTPVVGTPAGATPEILRPLDARLVTAGTGAGHLAADVIRVLEDVELMSRVRERARRHAEDYGWEQVVARHVEIYRRHRARRRPWAG